MDEFLKMDIFFAITTAAVVALSIFAAIALHKLARVLAGLERIIAMAEKETERVTEDLEELRAKAKVEGLKLRHVVGFLTDLRKPKVRTKK